MSKSKPNEMVCIGELVHGKVEAKMDHSVCFVPYVLASDHVDSMFKEHLTRT